MSGNYWWFDYETNKPVLEIVAGSNGVRVTKRGQSRRGKGVDHNTIKLWDPGISYKIGDTVKHNSLIYDAISDNFDCEPMWPRPDCNPWKLSID
jgi:hypothetical protein